VVSDLDGDGFIDILLVDSNSNVACFSAAGHEIWTNRMSGYPDEAPILGDVDQDGVLDVVIGSNAGHLWAFRGNDGEVLEGFPIRLGGRVLGKVLLADLISEQTSTLTRYMITMATDGVLYVIDPKTGCRERFGVGDVSDTMVLLEDLDGSGTLDLLITSTSGHVIAIGTNTPSHPLNTWTQSVLDQNIFVHRKNYRGIFFTDDTLRGLFGRQSSVYFCIEDFTNDPDPVYFVSVTWGRKMVLFERNFYLPGCFAAEVSVPGVVSDAILEIRMLAPTGEVFTDTIPVTFNKGFADVFPYMILLPLLLVSFGVLIQSQWLKRVTEKVKTKEENSLIEGWSSLSSSSSPTHDDGEHNFVLL